MLNSGKRAEVTRYTDDELAAIYRRNAENWLITEKEYLELLSEGCLIADLWPGSSSAWRRKRVNAGVDYGVVSQYGGRGKYQGVELTPYGRRVLEEMRVAEAAVDV